MKLLIAIFVISAPIVAASYVQFSAPHLLNTCSDHVTRVGRFFSSKPTSERICEKDGKWKYANGGQIFSENFCATGLIQAVDLNNDGVDDLTCQEDSGKVKGKVNNGDGTWQPEVTFKVGSAQLQICSEHNDYNLKFWWRDLNSDGIPDMICFRDKKSGSDSKFYVYYGTNQVGQVVKPKSDNVLSNIFCSSSTGILNIEVHVSLADFDGDGRIEIVCGRRMFGTLPMGTYALELNPNTFQLQKEVRLPQDCDATIPWYTDVNGDGYTDFLCYPHTVDDKTYPGVVKFSKGTSTPSFLGKIDGDSNYPKYPWPLWCLSSEYIDMDGDGRQDVYCRPFFILKAHWRRNIGCKNRFTGGLCEQKVCNFAPVTKTTWFNRMWINPNSVNNFDFHLPTKDLYTLKQSFQQGTLGIDIAFTPQSAALSQYFLSRETGSTSVNVGSTSLLTDCNAPAEASFQQLQYTREEAPVGKLLFYKITAGWYQAPPDNVPDGVFPSVNLNVHRVSFLTKFVIEAKDKSGKSPVSGIKVEYKMAASSTWKLATTAAGSGKVEITLEEPLIANGVANAMLEIRASKVTNGIVHDIRFCGLVPSSDGNICDDTADAISTVQVDHIPDSLPTFFIADYSAVPISGKVDFEFSDKVCGISGVTVSMVNGDSTVGPVFTEPDGSFVFSAAVSSKVFLQVSYNNHTFTTLPSDDDSTNIFDNTTKLEIQAGREYIIRIIDVTTRTITLQSGFTACHYPLNGHQISITAHQCTATMNFEMPSDENKFETVVPAHKFDILYTFGDTTLPAGVDVTLDDLDNRFYDTYLSSNSAGSNVVDMTTNDGYFSFQYHVTPSLELSFEGFVPYRSFPESCAGDVDEQFDIALAGNTASTHFQFFLQEVHTVGEAVFTCELASPGTTMELKSFLGVPEHECDWAQLGEDDRPGCLIPFHDVLNAQNNTISMASIPLPVGQPKKLRDGEDISSVYKRIEVGIRNPVSWVGFSQEDLDLAPIKVLIVGTEFISADSTVSVPQEIPLKLLYAPPTAGSSRFSFAQLETKISVGTTTKLVDMVSTTNGLSVTASVDHKTKVTLCGGFGVMTCKETIDVKVNSAGTIGGKSVVKTFNEDSVSYDGTTETLTLKTPPGLHGEAGDMALLLGVTAKYVRTRLHTFDESSCSIDYREETKWDNELRSMVFMSYRDCVGQRQLAHDTIAVQNALLARSDLTSKEREEYRIAKAKALNAVNSWNSLLAFWDKDKLAAESFPVALTDFLSEDSEGIFNTGTNLLNMGASTVSLSEERETNADVLEDYTVYTKDLQISTDTGLSTTLFGYGVSLKKNRDFVNQWSYDTTTRKAESISSKYVVTFYEDNAEDNIAVQIFRSPFSKTYVFKTFGGITRCPHLPGTDPHQKVEVDLIEHNKAQGYFVLEVSTERMENFPSGDKQSLDLEIALSDEVITMPVSFTIGSATVNQPFFFGMDAGKAQQVFIKYERSLDVINRLTVTGKVSSRCDSSVSAAFAFTTNWDSPCALVGWGGALRDVTSTWILSNSNPEMDLTIVNEGDREWDAVNNLRIAVLYKSLDRSGSDWQELPRSYYGDVRIEREEQIEAGTEISFASITLKASEMAEIFANEERFMIEARAICPDGDSRSGPRVGMLDMKSPELQSWKFVTSTIMSYRAIEVAGLMFAEPIDCENSELVTLVEANGIEFASKFLCTAAAHQLSVYVRIQSDEQLRVWSAADITLTIEGIHDMNGNVFMDPVYELDDAVQPVPGMFYREFQAPSYAGNVVEALPVWSSDESIQQMNTAAMASARATVLPSSGVNSFSIVGEPDPIGLDSGAIAGIVVGTLAGVVAVGGAAKYIKSKYYHDTLTTATELEVVADVKVHTTNPLFADDSGDSV